MARVPEGRLSCSCRGVQAGRQGGTHARTYTHTHSAEASLALNQRIATCNTKGVKNLFQSSVSVFKKHCTQLCTAYLIAFEGYGFYDVTPVSLVEKWLHFEEHTASYFF
jgi:hypothetical protein